MAKSKEWDLDVNFSLCGLSGLSAINELTHANWTLPNLKSEIENSHDFAASLQFGACR